MRESLISSKQRNHTYYTLFTLDKDTPTWGRFRFMEMVKSAKDNIPNDLLQWSPENTTRDGELKKLVDPLLAQDTWVKAKEDGSPVTGVDLAAEEIIYAGLQRLDPSIPYVSEERELPDYDTRRVWPRYWLVDPLDGTKEFINRTDEFTVNIALIEAG